MESECQYDYLIKTKIKSDNVNFRLMGMGLNSIQKVDVAYSTRCERPSHLGVVWYSVTPFTHLRSFCFGGWKASTVI